MTEVGARDRWIMAGLVTLGLFTVIAGVLSGRSTIDYVLGRDAAKRRLPGAKRSTRSCAVRKVTPQTAPRPTSKS
ncbi:hypothetical protein [Methyloceanibacter marginalis]|nr:hypothetical protein [Methyloceanibacter marginalis]